MMVNTKDIARWCWNKLKFFFTLFYCLWKEKIKFQYTFIFLSQFFSLFLSIWLIFMWWRRCHRDQWFGMCDTQNISITSFFLLLLICILLWYLYRLQRIKKIKWSKKKTQVKKMNQKLADCVLNRWIGIQLRFIKPIWIRWHDILSIIILLLFFFFLYYWMKSRKILIHINNMRIKNNI